MSSDLPASEGWEVTPEVLLFIAGAAVSAAVIVFGIWLFVRASREGGRR